MADPRDRAWRAYVEKILAKRGKEAKGDEAEEEPIAEFDVLEPNHDIPVSEAPTAVKRLLMQMHEPELRKSVTFQYSPITKTGPNAGKKRWKDKELVHYGAKSVSDRYILTANWSGGKFSFARFYDRETGEIRFAKKVGELEGWLKNE